MAYSNAPMLISGTVTVSGKSAVEHNYSKLVVIFLYLKRTQGGPSCLLIKFYPIFKRNPNSQSIIRLFYSELALSETTSLNELAAMYRQKIEAFDEMYSINVPFRFFKIWIKGKNIDMHQRMIEKEKRDSLLARYLLATASSIYKESDLVELIVTIANKIHSENTAFADGMKLIHKVIAMNNPELLRALLKCGFNINVLTERGDKFLPGKPK